MLHYQDISSYIFFDRSRSKVSNQWRVQDFLLGAPTPKVGELTYYFAIFFLPKTAYTRRNLDLVGAFLVPPLDPPMIT